MIRGSFDIVTTTEAHGWAYLSGQGERVLVQAVLNQEILGEARADIHRSDLAAAGLGDGNSGYIIKFFRPIDPLYLPFITIKVDGGDAELPRAPLLGFKEFFAALHAKHPASGWHRSVSGGLWTDRVDAAALLQGKIRIGTLSPAVAPAIEQLITNGIATIDLAAVPDRKAGAGKLAESIGTLLEDGAVLPLLQGILEDTPVAVKVAWVEEDETQFSQPSLRTPAPSPGDCVELVVACAEGVSLDVIRDSHKLPEFTLHGQSRWTSGAMGDVAVAAGAMGLLDRQALPAGMAALVGPGTIYQIHCESGAVALRIMVLPARGRTVAMAANSTGKGKVRESGAMVLI